jgi:hypothetical protein
MTRLLRVFVNGNALDVSDGATALDCVRQWNGEEADAIAAKQRLITDSRGLAIGGDTVAHAGSIFRTVTNRGADAPR